MYLAGISLHPLYCCCWSLYVNKLLFLPWAWCVFLLNSVLKFEFEMGPSPTPPPPSSGYRFCSCGSGSISHCNPGLMISPSTVITPVPGAPSLAQHARDICSFSFSRPSGHKAHTGKGVTVKSLSPTPCAKAGRGGGLCCSGPTNWTNISGGGKMTPPLRGKGLPLADFPACLQLQ